MGLSGWNRNLLGMRGPFTDSLLDGRAGDVVDASGGPVGVIKAGVFLVAVTVAFVSLVVGTEAFLGVVLGPWAPDWLAFPLLIASVGIAIVGGFVGLLRFMTWRRRRW